MALNWTIRRCASTQISFRDAMNRAMTVSNRLDCKFSNRVPDPRAAASAWKSMITESSRTRLAATEMMQMSLNLESYVPEEKDAAMHSDLVNHISVSGVIFEIKKSAYRADDSSFFWQIQLETEEDDIRQFFTAQQRVISSAKEYNTAVPPCHVGDAALISGRMRMKVCFDEPSQMRFVIPLIKLPPDGSGVVVLSV